MADSNIRYIRSSDQDVGALAMPDYSTVTTSNKLGTCLCFQNPKEERFYRMKADVIEKQKRRRQVAWQLAQRRFLIRQVFEKGLAPSIGRRSPDYSVLDGEAMSATPDDRDYYISVSPCASPQADLPRSLTLPDIRPKYTDDRTQHVIRSGDGRKSGADSIQTLPPIADAEPGAATLARSRSLQDLGVHHFERSIFPSYHYRPAQLAPLVETERENDPSAVTGTQDFRSQISPMRSRRRNLAELKKHPENLFPKMRFLIEHGPDALETEDSNDDLSDDVRYDAGYKRAVREDQVMPEDSTKDTPKANYLKMIQKITTYLPEHLLETAQKQVREMTNTDAIYRQKEKLLSCEREKINIEDNAKWRELKQTLSPRKPVLHLRE